ncbi:MAG: hypothetical protein GX796_00755 [Clostridiaceae bacterium]|nr:hypothetical protein [Clostridiaceae bacterium]
MKNRKIPGFPSPEDQDAIKFYLFKTLSYTTRMLLYLGCIIFGFLLQIITVNIWPGVILLIFASLLILVKGYSTKPTPASRQYEDSWAKTNMEKVHQINQIKQNINKWDKDALDISNGLGCVTFILVFIAISFICVVIATGVSGLVAGIFIVDSIILLASIWFNGMKTKGHQEILYIKTDLVVELEKYFEKIKNPGENHIPSMILAKDKEGKEFPTDCRFNIVFENSPADFYGIQAQININVVSSASYPYFYCVITAKEGFGLEQYTSRLVIPKGITIEFSKDEGAEVIVIRQRTTKNSGYHTKINACNNILEFSLSLSRVILESNSK